MFEGFSWVCGWVQPRRGSKPYELRTSLGGPRGLLFDPYPVAGVQTPWYRSIFELGNVAYEANVVLLRETVRSRKRRPITADEIQRYQEDVHSYSGHRPSVLRLRFPGLGEAPVVLGPSEGVVEWTDSDLRSLRWLELRALLAWSGAVKRLDKGQFELPSGGLSTAFIRVGDALNSHAAVSGVADWLDDQVRPRTAVVSDTWTILPLLQELRTRAAADGWDLPIRTLSGYPSAAEVADLVHEVRAMPDDLGVDRVLFLVSVAASRKLITNIEAVGRGGGWGRSVKLKVQVLVGTSKDPEGKLEVGGDKYRELFCVVGDVRQTHARRQEELAGSTPVRIDRTRYYPLLEHRPESRFITSEVATAHKELWEAANRTSAITVHRWDNVKQRSLAVHFDVGRLLGDPRFQRRVVGALRASVPLADIVVVPRHQSTSALRALARLAYTEVPITVVSAEEDRLVFDPPLDEVCAEVQDILLLDDVVVLGQTTRRIHRHLQEEFARLRRKDEGPDADYQISAFAVLARPSSKGRWNRLKASLFHGDGRLHLEAAEMLLVPDDLDPFEAESRDLEIVQGVLGEPEYLRAAGIADGRVEALRSFIDARLARLRSREGMASDLYPSRSDEWDEPAAVTPHSLFGNELSEVVAFAAVSTAMQEIRDNARSDGAAVRWDAPRILTAYHDPLLAAPFLRSAIAGEMELEGVAGEFREAVSELAFGPSTADTGVQLGSPILAGELMYASVVNRIPPAFRQDVWERSGALTRRYCNSWCDLQTLLRQLYHSEPNDQRHGTEAI